MRFMALRLFVVGCGVLLCGMAEASLQARIDACSAAGGGVVRVEQGLYEDMDPIVFKNHNPDYVVENVAVRNCRLASNTSFIKLGTETWGGFRNIRVSDCELDCRTLIADDATYDCSN